MCVLLYYFQFGQDLCFACGRWGYNVTCSGRGPIRYDLWSHIYPHPLAWQNPPKPGLSEDAGGIGLTSVLEEWLWVHDRLVIVWRWCCSTDAGSELCHCLALCALWYCWDFICKQRVGAWGTGLCCCGCLLAPPFQPSIEYIKWTLLGIAATPLQQTRSNGRGRIYFTSWMSFRWFRLPFVLFHLPR